MANHLIIGLGGTGGKVLRAIRKRVFEGYGTNRPEGNVNVSYIYMDSDERDLTASAHWRFMGNPVGLSPNQKVNIHGMAGGVLNNLPAYPGIHAFVNEQDHHLLQNDRVTSIVDAGIGGQRRRFGRMLLANNITNEPNNGFVAVVRDRVLQMIQETGDGTMSIHICAGLAGGTGSGTIVDAIAQLHKLIEPMGNAFDVRLYLFVPEIMVENGVAVEGYYHGNGYAALQELNALSLGTYHPVDVSGEMDRANGHVRRLISGENVPAFKCAYLFTDHNEANRVLEKNEKLPAAVADFLYQRIFSEERMETMLGRVVDLENEGAFAEQDAAGRNVHARNFMTFGIKRVEYPEMEVKTIVESRCEVGVILGLLCNLWVHGRGYIPQEDEAAGVGLLNEVQQPATQEALWLNSLYLTLQKSVPGFNGSEDWGLFSEYWQNVCTFFATSVLEEEKRRNFWVERFLEYTEPNYEANFRNLGVHAFFASMGEGREIRRYASVIIKHIEERLFSEWVQGLHQNRPMSLQKIRLYLSELEGDTRKRLQSLAEHTAVLNSSLEEIAQRVDWLAAKLRDAGWLVEILFSRAKTLFMEYAQVKAEFYTIKTQLEANEYARLLMTEIIARLNAMSQSVVRLENLFRAANETATNQAGVAMQLQQVDNANEVQVVDKHGDMGETSEIVDSYLLRDEELMKAMRNAVMQRFNRRTEETGGASKFATLYGLLGGAVNMQGDAVQENPEVLLRELGLSNRDYQETAVQQLAEADPTRQLLGVNILQRLQQEYPTDELLDAYLHRLVQSCTTFLQFNQAERGKVAGNGQLTQQAQGVQICIPRFDDPSNFREHFIERLLAQFEGNWADRGCVTENAKSNQIVIIMLYAGFPLRFVQNLTHLRNQYDLMVSSHHPNSAINKMLFHTESLNPAQLPSLFEEAPEVVRKQVQKLVFKAYLTPGVISEGQNMDGEMQAEISVGSRLERKNYSIGMDYLQTVGLFIANARLRQCLTNHIEAAYGEVIRTRAAKQEMATKLEDYLFDVVLPLCGGNERNPDFVALKDVVVEMIGDLKG